MTNGTVPTPPDGEGTAEAEAAEEKPSNGEAKVEAETAETNGDAKEETEKEDKEETEEKEEKEEKDEKMEDAWNGNVFLFFGGWSDGWDILQMSMMKFVSSLVHVWEGLSS